MGIRIQIKDAVARERGENSLPLMGIRIPPSVTLKSHPRGRNHGNKRKNCDKVFFRAFLEQMYREISLWLAPQIGRLESFFPERRLNYLTHVIILLTNFDRAIHLDLCSSDLPLLLYSDERP